MTEEQIKNIEDKVLDSVHHKMLYKQLMSSVLISNGEVAPDDFVEEASKVAASLVVGINSALKEAAKQLADEIALRRRTRNHAIADKIKSYPQRGDLSIEAVKTIAGSEDITSDDLIQIMSRLAIGYRISPVIDDSPRNDHEKDFFVLFPEFVPSRVLTFGKMERQSGRWANIPNFRRRIVSLTRWVYQRVKASTVPSIASASRENTRDLIANICAGFMNHVCLGASQQIPVEIYRGTPEASLGSFLSQMTKAFKSECHELYKVFCDDPFGG